MSKLRFIAKKLGYENKYRFLMSVIFDVSIIVLFTLILLALQECSCVTGIPYMEYLACINQATPTNNMTMPINLTLPLR